MRLDGVEIKVTVACDRTPAAVEGLELPPDRPPWRIYFCEDVTEGLPAGTPLLDAGVILRARDKPGGKDDTTVKLRPCRRSQLVGRWLAAEKGDDWDFKVEADWSGERRALAASLTADRKEGVVAAVGHGPGSVEDLFVVDQVAFLRECAAIRVNLGALTVLPPVAATRWGTVESAPASLDVRAERWTVGALDFLELSTVAELGEAPATQDLLVDFVGSRGITVPPHQETKTRQVLRYLVEQVLPHT
jgi:hypothetical protein